MTRILMISLGIPALRAAQSANPLKEFFEARLAKGGTSTLEEHVGAAEQSEKCDQSALKDAFPAIMAALKSSDTFVSVDAALFLTSIARRPDSGLLPRPVHADIVALLNRNDTRFGGAAVLIIESETPAPKD